MRRGFSTEPLGPPVFTDELEEVGWRRLKRSGPELEENQERVIIRFHKISSESVNWV